MEILKNPQVRFGREPFSRMKHQKIYRLILLPSHFYSSGEFPSSGLVTNLAEHFGGNLKNNENHDFQAALATLARMSMRTEESTTKNSTTGDAEWMLFQGAGPPESSFPFFWGGSGNARAPMC